MLLVICEGFPLEYQCMKFGFVSYNDPLFFGGKIGDFGHI